MTCPGDCISGGGQPKHRKPQMAGIRQARIEQIYAKDFNMKLRTSYENQEIQRLYEEFYNYPLSHLSEELLHTTYVDRSDILGNVDPLEDEITG